MGLVWGTWGSRQIKFLSTAVILLTVAVTSSLTTEASAGPLNLAISRVSPDWSLTSGNSTVVIEGSGFTQGTLVWFGQTPASEVRVLDADHLRVLTPKKAPGKYTVQVNTPEGQIKTLPLALSFIDLPNLGAPVVSGVTRDSFSLSFPTKPTGWLRDNAWSLDLLDPVTGEALTSPCWQNLNAANLWPTGTLSCVIQYSGRVQGDRDYDLAYTVSDWAGHYKRSSTTRIHLPAAPAMPTVSETLNIDEVGLNGFTLSTPDLTSFNTRIATPDHRYMTTIQLLSATNQPIGWLDGSPNIVPCPEGGCTDSFAGAGIEPISNTQFGAYHAEYIKSGTTYKVRIQLYDSKYSRSTYGPTTTITTVTQAPDSPEEVSAEIPDLTSANVSWLRPTDTGGAPIQKYEVSVTQTAPSAAASTLRQQLSSRPQAATSGTTKYTIYPGAGRKVSKSLTGLDSKSAYAITVVAINKSGRSSAAGIVVDLSTRIMTLKTALPNISGPALVGSVLSATPGSWTTGTTFSYQWKRGTTNIGTNSSTYTLTAADVGKRITVVVTGKKSRYRTQSVTSQPTGVVR